ncbi:unnamed protein product [Paramecium primaurelia]|uniref:C-CAP/cofactor C-like domain-containing protein n=1 Tax=Paramecium primaurelia TaxID=5886 RepID=A0A8S1M8W1_PARPR|nr:unnamed protein product [Paramecium primaurelia]
MSTSELSQQQQLRKQQFEAYLNKQADKLKNLKDRRQEFKLQTKDPKELQLHVQKEFRQLYDNILTPINQKTIKTEEQIQQVIDEFQVLFQYYVDINYALIAYDKQQYKEQLDQLECTIFTLRSQIIPRQKFRFSKPFPKGIPQQSKIQEEKLSVLENDSIVITQDNYQESITLENGSLLLKNLENTTFSVEGSLDTFYLHNLKNLKVKFGDVKGSVWVDKCQNCEFQGSMHQLRIHDTVDCAFIIYVTSNPIIERCSKLSFSRLGNKDFNLFDQVQDFNWLKQEKSPNFTIV